ncbi:hypothetical protein HPB48_023100 [Haemaphysalis longicornis]|uniref:COMM domain-containing protein n=1 Tax=Haemaphysalis longicornis TaxID=44386 RepID=A0A9J6GM66_HAELO|nr:hypothetical protein HPB48_023100 [Haemaphysalis longicornis]
MKSEDVKLSGGKPSSAVVADIQAINALGADEFTRLLDVTCRLSTGASSNSSGDASGRCGETLFALLSEASRRGMDAPQLCQALESLGLDATRASPVAERWLASRTSARTQVRPWQLRDVEWRFGVTVASSANEPRGSFVQMRLALAGGQDVHVEMNLAQFYSLCNEMEQAKLTLEALR